MKTIAVDPMDPNVAYAGTDTMGVFWTTDGGATWKQLACGLPPSLIVNKLSISGNYPFLLYAATNSGVYALPLVSPGCWSLVTSLPLTSYGILENQPYPPYDMFAATSNVVYSSNSGGAWAPVGPPFLTGISALCPDPKNMLPFLASGGDGFFADNGGAWAPQNDGLSAHDTESVAVSSTNARVAFAASADRGVYKTIDAGLTWNEVTGDRANLVYIDPSNPDVVYAATTATPWSYFLLKKSTDGGATWSFIHYGLSGYNSKIFSLAIDATDPLTIYAGTDNGLWKSKNGGATWSAMMGIYYIPWSFEIRAVVIDPVDPAVVYAAGATGVYKSTDSGVTWSPTLGSLLRPLSLAIRPDGRILYAGTEDGKVYGSTSGGATWWLVSTGLGTAAVASLVIDPRHQDVLYAGTLGGGVFQSTDRGITWSAYNTGDPNPFVNQLAISPTGVVLYAATGGSVYEFENGGPIPPSEGK